jgi:hypothetical protein
MKLSWPWIMISYPQRMHGSWLINWNKLNVAKTEFLLIGPDHKKSNLVTQPVINIDQIKIKQVHNSKVLGVEIDDKLNWNKHIEAVAKKISLIERLGSLSTMLFSVFTLIITVRYSIPWVHVLLTDFKHFRIALQGYC